MKPDTLLFWRKRLNFTQEEAGLALGCPYRTYQAWESGERAIPNHLGLACAALSLGIPEYPEPETLMEPDFPAKKTTFDRKSYQKQYMREYRKTHRYARKD
jgi:transcriptional regulator with XRE-family HTH domain